MALEIRAEKRYSFNFLRDVNDNFAITEKSILKTLDSLNNTVTQNYVFKMLLNMLENFVSVDTHSYMGKRIQRQIQKYSN